MIYNYHTHTTRCRHAQGSDEEYIKRAIEGGIKYMGFADHAPFVFHDGYESGYRVPVLEARDYVLEISKLREKYRDKIDIKIGFEMEYYPTYFVDMFKSAVRFGAEYLILGHHYLHEEHPHGVHVIEETNSILDLNEYVSSVVSGIKSRVFTYVAHPDMLNFTGEISVFKEAIRKICRASKECDVPLELNFLGIRDNRIYPNTLFWEIAGEEQAPVTFGLDSHKSCDAYDGESLAVAERMVKKYKLNYIGKPKLIFIQDIEF